MQEWKASLLMNALEQPLVDDEMVEEAQELNPIEIEVTETKPVGEEEPAEEPQYLAVCNTAQSGLKREAPPRSVKKKVLRVNAGLVNQKPMPVVAGKEIVNVDESEQLLLPPVMKPLSEDAFSVHRAPPPRARRRGQRR